MTVSNEIILGIITLIIFLILDFIWLKIIADTIYQKFLGHMMAKKPNLKIALIFYLIFIMGLMIFVIIPALNQSSFRNILIYAPLFGLTTYATFDLTSEAIFKDWPLAISIIDISWGIVLTTLTAILSYVININIIR